MLTNQGSAYRRPSFKRQNPFIQLLTEGKKLRENAKEKDWSDEEYLEKLKEIRQMNAKEKRLLYEKYGRARSSLAKVDTDGTKKPCVGGPNAAALWIDFSDILNSSGRRTVNSDTYIINDLKLEEIKSDDDDDQDVTMIPDPRKRSISNGSSGYKSDEDPRNGYPEGRRRSSVFEAFKNFICLGHQ